MYAYLKGKWGQIYNLIGKNQQWIRHNTNAYTGNE